MKSGTRFEAGDLLLIPFPYADLHSGKKRPVLALTAPDRYGDFIALAVTTKPHHEHALELSDECLASGRLPRTSWVRVDKVFTLESAQVLKAFGTVRTDVVDTVVGRLCGRLGYGVQR